MLSPSRPGRRAAGARRSVVALAGLPLLLLPACGTVPAAAPAASASATASAEPDRSGPSDGACEYTVTGTPARPVQPPSSTDVASSGTVTYVIHLSAGDVSLHLDRAKAPCTVHSFESLVAQHFYDRTSCPRLTDSGIFVLQCGDPTGTTSGGPGYTFPDETDGSETYSKGTVAMANAGPNTNGSQFFLVWDDSDLDPKYTVFATFDEKSREVVAAIASQGEDGSRGPGDGKPNAPAQITSITKAS